MAIVIRHNFQSSKVDGPNSDLLQPSHWNADHVVEGTVEEAPQDGKLYVRCNGAWVELELT